MNIAMKALAIQQRVGTFKAARFLKLNDYPLSASLVVLGSKKKEK